MDNEQKKEYVAPQMTVMDMNDCNYILCGSCYGDACGTEIGSDIDGD